MVGWDLRSVMFYVVPALVLLLVIVLVVAFTRHTLADGTAILTPRRLVEAYVFTVLLAAMLLVSVGLADLVRAGIASYAGLETSYRPRPVYKKIPPKPADVKFEYDSHAPRRDLLSGSAQLGMGFLIGILHLFGLRRLGRNEPLTASPIYRLFLIIGLVIYTTATLSYAVMSVKDFLVYKYAELPPLREWYNRPLPGDKLAGVIGFLPLWGLLVVQLFRYARPRNTPS